MASAKKKTGGWGPGKSNPSNSQLNSKPKPSGPNMGIGPRDVLRGGSNSQLKSKPKPSGPNMGIGPRDVLRGGKKKR